MAPGMLQQVREAQGCWKVNRPHGSGRLERGSSLDETSQARFHDPQQVSPLEPVRVQTPAAEETVAGRSKLAVGV